MQTAGPVQPLLVSESTTWGALMQRLSTSGCAWSPIPLVVLPCSQRTDMGVWTDMLADWARSLQSPDVEDPKSPAYRRIDTLCQLLLRGMRLKVSCF